MKSTYPSIVSQYKNNKSSKVCGFAMYAVYKLLTQVRVRTCGAAPTRLIKLDIS